MCDKPRLIGLVGATGAGKSTFAALLTKHGYERLSMAKPLKDMLATLGLTEHDLYGPQAHRLQPSQLLCGKSPRYAMQTLGTEWGREIIGPDIWVNAMQERIIADRTKRAFDRNRGKKGFHGIVIEDVRFPNEFAMIERLGGVIWSVRRPEVEVPLTRWDRWNINGNAVQRFAARVWSKLTGNPLIHASEAHWLEVTPDAEFWNGEDIATLDEALTNHLKRLA